MNSAGQGGKQAKTIKSALLVFARSLKWIRTPLALSAMVLTFAELALANRDDFSKFGWGVLPDEIPSRIWFVVEILFFMVLSFGVVLSVSKTARPADPRWWLIGLSDYAFMLWYFWCFAHFEPATARILFVVSVLIYYGPEIVVLKEDRF